LNASSQQRYAAALDEYRAAREDRLKGASKSVQNASTLVLCSLQKRLLSSIEAFASTLKVHRKAFEANGNAGLMAAILEREPPPLSSLQPLAPPALERLVATCLAKDPTSAGRRYAISCASCSGSPARMPR
jgi:hypothetical protein